MIFDVRAGWTCLFTVTTACSAAKCSRTSTWRVVVSTTLHQMRKQKHDPLSRDTHPIDIALVPNQWVSHGVIKMKITHTHLAVIYYWLACLASAAISTGVAEDGTWSVNTGRRHWHWQLESSNNGENEGETHHFEMWYGISKEFKRGRYEDWLLCPAIQSVLYKTCPPEGWNTYFKQTTFALMPPHCQQISDLTSSVLNILLGAEH